MQFLSETLLWVIVGGSVYYFLSILYMSQRGANYVRTPPKDIQSALSVLKAKDIFIDLGFGNGEVMQAAAKKNAAQVIGYELDYIRFLRTWWKLRKEHTNFIFRYADIWSADLSKADVVYTFFTDIHMARLYEKATREMKNGSWFVSYVHEVPNVTPTKKLGQVRLYRIHSKK